MLQVALHEIGHALGLDHFPDPASVMNANLNPGNAAFDATDIAGIQALYGPRPSAPAPAPVPAPVPPPVPVPSGPDRLVVTLSEDAYQGDARFTVAVNGRQVGAAQSATALHGAGKTQDFAFSGGFGAGPHQVSVSFLNDLWTSGVGDRNLYVQEISLNGAKAAVPETFVPGGPGARPRSRPVRRARPALPRVGGRLGRQRAVHRHGEAAIHAQDVR